MSSLRNVKSMVVLVSLLVLFVHALSEDARAWFDSTCCHTAVKGINWNTPDAYFNPIVRVCNKQFPKECRNLSLYGERCKYVFPTIAKLYLDAVKTTDADGIEYDTGELQVCAFTVVACDPNVFKDLVAAIVGIIAAIIVVAISVFSFGAGFQVGIIVSVAVAGSGAAVVAGVHAGVEVGSGIGAGFSGEHPNRMAKIDCFPMPLAPGPPPFCDTFQRFPSIRVMPVQYKLFNDDPPGTVISTLSAPKVKIALGYGIKTCADGSKVRSYVPCEDGSVGSVVDTVRVFDVDHDEEMEETISNEGYTYNLKIKYDIPVGQICVKYRLTGGTDEFDEYVRCIPAPTVPRPIVSMPSGASISNPSIDVRFEGLGDDRVYNISRGNPQTLFHDSVDLNAFYPSINDTRDFSSNIECSGDKNDDGTCEGNEPPSEVSYKDTSSGNVLCLEGYHGGEYYTKDRGDVRRVTLGHDVYYLRDEFFDIEELKKGILPDIDLTVDVEDLKQSELDTMVFPNGSVDELSFYRDGRYLKYKANSASYVPYGEEPEDGVKYTEVDLAGGEKSYIVYTPFKDEYGRPFVKAGRHEELRALDPYKGGLCIIYGQNPANRGLKFDSYDYQYRANKKHQINLSVLNSTRKCDFLTIEAWGGGASGYIYPESDTDAELITRNSLSFSGASGGYARGTIKVDNALLEDTPLLSLRIGSGGSVESSLAGKNTIIELCKSDGTGCNKLMIAMAGLNNRVSGLGVVASTSADAASPSAINFSRWKELACDFRNNNHATCRKIEYDYEGEDSELFSTEVSYKNVAQYLANSLFPRYTTNILFRDIRFGIEGEPESEDRRVPRVAMTYSGMYGSNGYLNEDHICNNESAIRELGSSSGNVVRNIPNLNNSYGAGGCVNREYNVIQEGANGGVRIYCEQWNSYSGSGSFNNAINNSTNITEDDTDDSFSFKNAVLNIGDSFKRFAENLADSINK